MIGKPGCGVLQMNGQPTAAEHPRVRLPTARCPASATGRTPSTSPSSPGSGTSSPTPSPTGTPPTHAMQIFRYAEAGSIKFLWIIATNPAVSMPDLPPHPQDPRQGGPVPGRAGRLPDRDGRARRRRPARGDLGREDRHVHQRRPHRPHLAQGHRARPARRGPTSTSSSTTPAGWTSATRTAPR